MQGKYAQLPAGTTRDLLTGDKGMFTVTEPEAASYTFKHGFAGSTCQDALTGVTVSFPYTLSMPAVTNATITGLSRPGPCMSCC